MVKRALATIIKGIHCDAAQPRKGEFQLTVVTGLHQMGAGLVEFVRKLV